MKKILIFLMTLILSCNIAYGDAIGPTYVYKYDASYYIATIAFAIAILSISSVALRKIYKQRKKDEQIENDTSSIEVDTSKEEDNNQNISLKM